MTDDELLDLARDDCERQERTSLAVRQTLQFQFTLGSAVGGTSEARFRPAMFAN